MTNLPSAQVWSHQDYMVQALAQAQLALPIAKPNPAVGCVIVSEGTIVGQGHTQPVGNAHAEIMALRMAGTQAKGATAYVTLEPCAHYGHTPPCSQALIEAGICHVVYGCQDPNPKVNGAGLKQLEAAGIQVHGPVMKAECQAINAGFFHAITHQQPFVFSKIACSLDGRTAMASGESQWITGSAARAQVHLLRAQSSAVITGVGTILADDPSLTARHHGLTQAGVPKHLLPLVKQPIRVIIDSQLRTPASAKIFSAANLHEAPVWIMTTCTDSKRHRALELMGAQIHVVAAVSAQVDLTHVLALLQQHPCQSIMIEAGATLNASFIGQQLIHRLDVFMAPKMLGSHAKPMLNAVIDRLDDASQWAWQQHKNVGDDLHLQLSLNHTGP